MTTETPNSGVERRLESIQGDMSEMRTVLRELTTAVTKLAVIEERQNQTRDELGRAFREIDKCNSGHEVRHSAEVADYKLLQLRIAALELQSPATKQTNVWVTSAMVGAVVLVAMFVAAKVGLR